MSELERTSAASAAEVFLLPQRHGGTERGRTESVTRSACRLGEAQARERVGLAGISLLDSESEIDNVRRSLPPCMQSGCVLDPSSHLSLPTLLRICRDVGGMMRAGAEVGENDR